MRRPLCGHGKAAFLRPPQLGDSARRADVGDVVAAAGQRRQLDIPRHDRLLSGGGLAAIYRYFGEHMKVGVGYNFTDFSDDLTDLSYDNQGVFFNFIGSL